MLPRTRIWMAVAGAVLAVAGLGTLGGARARRRPRPRPSLIDADGDRCNTEGAKHTFSFPSGFQMAAGASVTVRSGGPAGPGELAWTGASVWNNTGDTAYLVDPAGVTVSERACSE